MRRADSLLVLLAPVMFIWLSAIFVKRKLYRQFPFFFGYIVVVVMVAALRYAVSSDYALYFKVFWATEALYAVLAVFALHEAFRHVFVEFYELWWWFRLLFPSAVCILASLEIVDTVHHFPSQPAPIITLILSFGMTVTWIQSALFGLMCLLVWLVGNWEYYPVGIVVGFATSALGAWAAYAARSVFGTKLDQVGKYGPPLAYFVAALIWLITFLRPPKPDRWEKWSKTITPSQLLSEIREYLRILKGSV